MTQSKSQLYFSKIITLYDLKSGVTAQNFGRDGAGRNILSIFCNKGAGASETKFISKGKALMNRKVLSQYLWQKLWGFSI